MLIKIMLKQLSNRVSAKAIEETYTDIDVAHVKDKGKDTTDISLHYLPDTGFTFDYPQGWLNEQTDFKAIGIRRLKVVPTSHVFTIKFSIGYRYKNNKEDHGVSDIPYQASVTPANTLEEVIHDMINKLNGALEQCYLYENNQETGKEHTHTGRYRHFVAPRQSLTTILTLVMHLRSVLKCYAPSVCNKCRTNVKILKMMEK